MSLNSSTQRRPCRLLLTLAASTMLSGCAVINLAGTVAGTAIAVGGAATSAAISVGAATTSAAISVTGAAVSTGVSLTGRLVEKNLDPAIGSDIVLD